MRSKLTDQLLRWVKDERAPRSGERVGVAVSGGADSVALLLLLLEARERLGIVLSVVHLNHKLRGRASDADEKFVAMLAAKHNLPFHVESVDVQAVAKRTKTNLEDAARRARYSFFERLVDEGHVDWVAVAHTADDQAETVLAHILRGTGLAGLAGIHPVAGDVFRPLIAVRRADLRAHLRSKKQLWREDATNRDTTKMRARIRRKLLPLLERQFQTGVVQHLGTLAELARGDEELLNELANQWYARLVRITRGQSTIAIADLMGAEADKDNAETQRAPRFAEKKSRALGKRLVRLIVGGLKLHGGTRGGQLNAEHVRAVLHLADRGQAGRELQLPGGVRVHRERDTLVFSGSRGNEKSKDAKKSAIEFTHPVELRHPENAFSVPELGCTFRFRVIDWPEKTRDTRCTGSALDRDALRAPLVLRNWRPGDKLRPVGHRNAHKLKRLLNEKRIGRWARNGWPVLTSGGVLAWARGFPVAAEFAASARTRAGVVIVEEPVS